MIVAEAQHHLDNYLPISDDRLLLDGWQSNMDNVPVAPSLTGQARLDYITAIWQAEVDGEVTGDERSNLPPFNAAGAYWDAMVRCEHQSRLHSFHTTGDDHGPPDEEADAPPPTFDGH